MRIGELASQAGVNIQTIRFYERRGLLDKPRRLSSGYRHFQPETVELVRFIKRSQELGFTLNEVKQLLRLRREDPDKPGEIAAIAKAKVKSIDEKISDLQKMREELIVTLRSCECRGDRRRCRLLGPSVGSGADIAGE